MELIFIHGWGFDTHFWDALAPLLPEYKQQRVDLGFFGNSSKLETTPDASHILIGHSLGFVHGWRQRQDWKGWIAINSFPRFIKTPEKIGCVPESALRTIGMGLSFAPRKTMETFYERLGAQTPQGDHDIERLREGLDELEDCDIGNIPELPKVPGLVLASRKDPLVPETASEDLGRMAKAIAWHETGGHILPQSDPVRCAENIRKFLNET